MLLIQKGKPTRQVCGYCHRASDHGEFAHPRSRTNKYWVCSRCSNVTIQETLGKCRKQIESGIPPDARYSEIPIDFMPFMTDRWMGELRESLMAMHAESETLRTNPSLPSPYCMSAAK